MQKKLFRKIVAGALSVAMVLGMTAVSFAAEGGSYTGEGTSEGYVTDKVTSVDLPTASANVFNYKMDPQQLINQTGAKLHDEKTFEEGATVFFQGDDQNWYSKSQLVTVKNTGTVDLDIAVKAKLDGTPTAYTMADAADWKTTNTTAAELYLGLFVDGKEGSTAITSDSDVEVAKYGVKGNKENFAITTSGTEYAFKPIAGEEDWNSISFGLTGACNTNPGVDWSDLEKGDDAAVDVVITWTYEERAEGAATPEMLPVNAQSGPTATLTQKGLVTFANISGTNNIKGLGTISLVFDNGTQSGVFTYAAQASYFDNLKYEGTWTAEDGGTFTINLSEKCMNALPGFKAKVTIELADGSVLSTEEIQF